MPRLVDLNIHFANHNFMKNFDSSSSYPSLKGQLLLAMPQMDDPRFHRAVIFMVAHDEKGSMGIVINNPLPSPDFEDVLHQVGISDISKPLDAAIKSTPVMAGGPVESIHGFLLHSADFSQKDTIRIDDFFSLSGTIESLRAIISGYKPEKMIFTLGYAGWGAGQLEQELHDNVWVNVPASFDLVFDTKHQDKWEKAFSVIGANPVMMSAHSGRA